MTAVKYLTLTGGMPHTCPRLGKSKKEFLENVLMKLYIKG